MCCVKLRFHVISALCVLRTSFLCNYVYLCSQVCDVVCGACVCVLDTFSMENKPSKSSTSIDQEKTILHQWIIENHVLDPSIKKKNSCIYGSKIYFLDLRIKNRRALICGSDTTTLLICRSRLIKFLDLRVNTQKFP